MTPDTIQICAELEAHTKSRGLVRSTQKFKEFVNPIICIRISVPFHQNIKTKIKNE